MARVLSSVLRGVKHLGAVAESAFGPAGRRVVIQKSFGPPTRSWKAAVVARELEVYLQDRDESFGLASAKDLAIAMQGRSVDGTSLAVLLGQGLLEALVATGDAVAIVRAVDDVRTRLRDSVVPVADRALHVMSSAACGDAAVVSLIRDACAIVEPARVSVIPCSGASSRVVMERGYELEGGWFTPEFATNMTDPNQPVCALEDPLVVAFVDGCKEENARDVLGAMRTAYRAERPLLLLAPSFDPAIAALLRNANHASRFLAAGASIADFPEDGQRVYTLLDGEIPRTICAATCRVPEGPLDTCARALVSRTATRLTGNFGSDLVTVELGNDDTSVDRDRLLDALAAGRQAAHGVVLGGGRALEAAARAVSIDASLMSAFERPRCLLEPTGGSEGIWDPFTIVDSALNAARDFVTVIAK